MTNHQNQENERIVEHWQRILRRFLFCLLAVSLFPWGLFSLTGCVAANAKGTSFWETAGFTREEVVSVSLSYKGCLVPLNDEYTEKLLNALDAATTKTVEDSYIYDASEYIVIIQLPDKTVTPTFCWFSGRALGEDPDNYFNRKRDTRFDVTFDGKNYYHFEFSGQDAFWDEYDSRRGYDKAAKAQDLPQRGQLDGMDEWFVYEGTISAVSLQYNTWQELAEQSAVIAIAEYQGQVECADGASRSGSSCPDYFAVQTLLKGDTATPYVFNFDNQFVDLSSDMVHSSKRSLWLVPDGNTQMEIHGVYLPVSFAKYKEGQQYLVFASAFVSEEGGRSADQIVYAAYPIVDGKIYPWYNTELELFDATPLQEVENYLAEGK